MNKNKLMDLIYNKLADNYRQEQFDWRIVEDMCLDMSGEPTMYPISKEKRTSCKPCSIGLDL